MSLKRPYAKKPLQPVRLKGLELSGVPRRPLSLDGPLDLMDVIPPDPVAERDRGTKRDGKAERHTDALDSRSSRGRAGDVQPIHGR